MPRRKILYYDAVLTPLARKLRKEGTLGEVLLWKRLKGKAVRGVSFYRQHPIDKYIVDFFAPDHLLAIEVDGASHGFRGEKDLERQARLESLGITFLRFSEAEVRRDLPAVIGRVDCWLAEHGA